MRVLQVFNQYLEPGGEEEWVNQMRKLAGSEFSLEELRFHSRVWKGRGAPGFFKQVRWIWDNPFARRRFREEVAMVKPDAVVFHNIIPVGSFGLYEEADKLGLPILQYIHNFRPFSPSGTLWMGSHTDESALHGNIWPEVSARSWEKSFLKTAVLGLRLVQLRRSGMLDKIDKWIAVSQFMRDKFIEAGIPESKVVTLRHCWMPSLGNHKIQESDHYLFLGRLVTEKGVFTLLETWRILEKRLGSSCPRLVIAGSGPEEGKVHAAAQKLAKVECVGYVTGQRKADLLSNCRGLIAPSIWWEPLGLIVYEAYEACRPVLAARSGGLTETVQDHVSGYLHDPGNAQSLANSVELNESSGASGRLQMGLAGWDWLAENANPERWRQRFREILDSAVTR